MERTDFVRWIEVLTFGKRLPTAVYIHRPVDWRIIPPELAATVERAMNAARPDSDWNLLKLHTEQVAVTFLTYPTFDADPHPALAEATKINLNTGPSFGKITTSGQTLRFFTGRRRFFLRMIPGALSSLN